MFLPPLVNPMSDAEVKKMISQMKAKNQARGQIDNATGHGCVSEISVCCVRCGIVVLSNRETGPYYRAPSIVPPCPVCDSKTTKFDKGLAFYWNHQARKLLWDDLWA